GRARAVEVGTAGIAEASAAGVGVVREQQRERTDEAGVDLEQTRRCRYARSGVGGEEERWIGEALLQSVAHRGERDVLQTALCFQRIELVHARQPAVLGCRQV